MQGKSKNYSLLTTHYSLSKGGVTLIEAVVGIALVSMIVLSLYTALFNVTKLFADAKQKAGAVALANEKMEIVRNLDYEDIGLQGWVPNGPLLQTEDVSKNGFDYTVDTSIEYVDDPFDEQGDDDLIETDYKQARIEVSWIANDQEKSLIFVSKFVPNGLESDVGGGVLSINVVDGAGVAIPTATVRVDSVDDSPAIHGNATADEEGNVRLPGLPHQDYKVTVSKNDYETVETYPNPPASPFTPIDSNLTVIESDIVMKTITLNKSGDLTIKAVNMADESGIEGIDVDLEGGRLIGTDPVTRNLEQTKTTNSSGEIELFEISPGSYNITNLESLETSQLTYIGSDSTIPISLSSEDEKEVKLLFAERNADSLFIEVKDGTTLEPIVGAQVQVIGIGFDQTVTTGIDGLVYFPAPEDPPVTMSPEDYEVNIQAAGYSDYFDDVSVSELTQQEVLMNP